MVFASQDILVVAVFPFEHLSKFSLPNLRKLETSLSAQCRFWYSSLTLASLGIDSKAPHRLLQQV